MTSMANRWPKLAKVLVVDDEPDVGNLLELTFSRAGLTVTKAADGAECLKLLREMTPDAIVLDLMMPGISGFELLAALKSRYAPDCLPAVIILSACDDMESKVKGFMLGACQYLVKPVARARLVEVVRAALDQRLAKPCAAGG